MHSPCFRFALHAPPPFRIQHAFVVVCPLACTAALFFFLGARRLFFFFWSPRLSLCGANGGAFFSLFPFSTECRVEIGWGKQVTLEPKWPRCPVLLPPLPTDNEMTGCDVDTPFHCYSTSLSCLFYISNPPTRRSRKEGYDLNSSDHYHDNPYDGVDNDTLSHYDSVTMNDDRDDNDEMVTIDAKTLPLLHGNANPLFVHRTPAAVNWQAKSHSLPPTLLRQSRCQLSAQT